MSRSEKRGRELLPLEFPTFFWIGIPPSGDCAMRTPFALLPWLMVLMAVAGLACPVAAEDKDLRDKVLALNNVTGNKPLENKIKELIGDKDAAKKLVAAGAKVATEK